jgi:glycerate dehydrogenase
LKIVLLDGFTINPGDLTWDEFTSLGPCDIYDRTRPEEVLVRAADAELLLTNKTQITREHIGTLPRLKYIGVLATGTNVVDLSAARERGIPVTNVPDYSTKSVAQAAFALLLELTQQTGYHWQTVRAGRWTECEDWCYWDCPLIELDGLTMGVVGFGLIGRQVAHLATAFGMKVLAYNPTAKPAPEFVQFTDLETLLRQSDVVSLHCPLKPETRSLINAERISWMKPAALLLNTSRGLLVDESALADALNSGRLGGAGLDVLASEPPPADNPLLFAKNCAITPHLAWGTRATRERLIRASAENIRAFLCGKPQNVVNG